MIGEPDDGDLLEIKGGRILNLMYRHFDAMGTNYDKEYVWLEGPVIIVNKRVFH